MIKTQIKRTLTDPSNPNAGEDHEVVVEVRVAKHRELPNKRTNTKDYFVRLQAGDEYAIPNGRVELMVAKEDLVNYPIGKTYKLEATYHSYGPLSIVSLEPVEG